MPNKLANDAVARKTLAAIPFHVDNSVLLARHTVDLAEAFCVELAMFPAPERIMRMIEELTESAKKSRHATAAVGQMYLHLAYFIEEDKPVDVN